MFGRNAPSSPKTPSSPLRKIQKYLDKSLKKKKSVVGIEPYKAILPKDVVGSSSDDVIDHASSTFTQIENYSSAVDSSTSNLSEVTTNLAAATISQVPNSHPLTIRTGDKASYWCSSSDNLYVDKKCSERAYRVLSYRKDGKTGKRVIFDILDGKPYFLCHGEGKRITHNAIVFETKSAALSERFPSNQHLATKSGNGVHPRILVVFDVWGFCKRRRGGGESRLCEYAKFIKIEKYLDSPSPMPHRLPKKFVEPFYFPSPDYQDPTRMRTKSVIKRMGGMTTQHITGKGRPIKIHAAGNGATASMKPSGTGSKKALGYSYKSNTAVQPLESSSIPIKPPPTSIVESSQSMMPESSAKPVKTLMDPSSTKPVIRTVPFSSRGATKGSGGTFTKPKVNRK